MSMSSARRSVTDIGGTASESSPCSDSMRLMRVVRPDGSTATSSPGLSTPLATWPA